MAFQEKRASYVREFVQSLATTGDDGEERLRHVLQETMVESLVELEKRFKIYKERLHHERNSQTIKASITRTEKRVNSRFYHEYKNEKTSEVRHIHREALKNCYTLLTNDLDLFNTSLMDDLLASDVVSISDKDSIRGRDTHRRQNEEFYAYLVGRLIFEEFHKIFLPALSKDHLHVAEALISELDRLEDEYQDSQCVACRARKHIQLKRLATPLLMQKVIDLPMFTDLRSPGLSNNSKWAELRQSVSDADIIKAMEKKYPDFCREFQQFNCVSLECCCPTKDVTDTAAVNVPYDRLMSDEDSTSGFESCYSSATEMFQGDEIKDVLSFQVEDSEQDYKMTANPKGICLIINNSVFPGTDFVDRRGSDIDVYKLVKTFERLQFSIVNKNNLTSKELLMLLKFYASSDHSNYDAFVCAVLTHGDQDGLIGSDGVFIKTSELINFFKATKCPTLAGKPKIFLLQTSRGDGLMEGLSVVENEEDTKESIADEADFLIGFSTAEGYASFRNIATGSHYITALTRVLDSQADHHDLLECLTLTNREVSRVTMKGHSILNGRKQVPAPVFTLTKKVLFSSDPLWPHSADKD